VELVHDEVFDIMAKRLHRIKHPAAYLDVVAKRRARRLANVELRRAVAMAKAQQEIAMIGRQSSIEEIVDARLTLDRVMDAWKGLGELTQQTLVGVLAGMTAQQISDMTGASVFGIQKRIRQGRERLREVAGREYERMAQSDSVVPPANQLVVDERVRRVRSNGT
jgi:DNA-directed RNA polymerase specialized sigma24 family protein